MSGMVCCQQCGRDAPTQERGKWSSYCPSCAAQRARGNSDWPRGNMKLVEFNRRPPASVTMVHIDLSRAGDDHFSQSEVPVGVPITDVALRLPPNKRTLWFPRSPEARIASLFADLAQLAAEDDRLRAVLDGYAIEVTSGDVVLFRSKGMPGEARPAPDAQREPHL